MDIQEKQALQKLINEMHDVTGMWSVEQMVTHVWQAAKAQAVQEKTVKSHLVWNENKDECVGFLDSKDARYTATGDDRGMFGVTALGDYFRDLNDERNEFETQIVMIEAQEPAND